MNTFLDHQNWRYATKKFDPSKKIAIADLDFLKEAMRLASSSYGLQPYKILFIENPELRNQLLPASWGQNQIVDASHLVVFANYKTIRPDSIGDYFDNVCKIREIPLQTLQGYKDFMTGAIGAKSDADVNVWNQKQTYLVLGNLLNAAAELKIDVCPMEGFDAAQYNQILGLEALNVNAALVATVGYRSDDDATQHYKKVRKSNEDLFLTI